MSKRNILSIHRDIAKAQSRDFFRGLKKYEAKKPVLVNLEGATVEELRALAKQLGIEGRSKMKKAELIAAIGPIEAVKA